MRNYPKSSYRSRIAAEERNNEEEKSNGAAASRAARGGIAIPAAAADNQVIHIVTAEDLRTFARNCQLDSYSVGLSVLLDEDIDMGGEAIQPIPSFSGAFNGNGHSITNFTLATDGSHQGFFRYIEEGARVINLKLLRHDNAGRHA